MREFKPNSHNFSLHTWFYDLQSDGYSLDDKRNKLEGFGDLQDVAERYKKRDVKKDKDRTQKYFFVPKQELVDNEYDLSLSKYKEEVYEEVKYESPTKILKKLSAIESDIQKGIASLTELIK